MCSFAFSVVSFSASYNILVDLFHSVLVGERLWRCSFLVLNHTYHMSRESEEGEEEARERREEKTEEALLAGIPICFKNVLFSSFSFVIFRYCC